MTNRKKAKLGRTFEPVGLPARPSSLAIWPGGHGARRTQDDDLNFADNTVFDAQPLDPGMSRRGAEIAEVRFLLLVLRELCASA